MPTASRVSRRLRLGWTLVALGITACAAASVLAAVVGFGFLKHALTGPACPTPCTSQTLNRGGALFVGTARVRVPASGPYAIAITDRIPAVVVVAPDVGQQLVRALPAVGLGLAGGLLIIVGLVILALAWSSRRRDAG